MSKTTEKTKKGFYAVQFSFMDGVRRMAYKLTSQKLVGFIFASLAIFIICFFADHAKAFSVSVAVAGIRAIRDIAIALLTLRGGQDIVDRIVNGKDGRAAKPAEKEFQK